VIRNIERLPKKIYLIAAILLIAACGLISLLPRTVSDPIVSAKSVLQTIPLYPGATQIYREVTDTPGSQINHQSTFCSIECARMTYEAPDRREMVIRFYQSQTSSNKWLPRGDGYIQGQLSYRFRPTEFKGWRPGLLDSGFPWLEARYETRGDYIIDILTEEKARNTTGVEVIVRRLAPMPSDTPIATLVPPPPTAPLPIVPRSVGTQEPNIPFPLPTAP